MARLLALGLLALRPLVRRLVVALQVLALRLRVRTVVLVAIDPVKYLLLIDIPDFRESLCPTRATCRGPLGRFRRAARWRPTTGPTEVRAPQAFTAMWAKPPALQRGGGG
jgi:hypothetical protein